MFRNTALAALAASCIAFDQAGAEITEPSGESLSTEIVERGSPLTPYEVLMLYRQRSWVWEDGAGYFASSDRRFVAYSQGDTEAAVAHGRWEILPSGALCIRAEWTVADASYRRLDCFDHSRIGDIVYQRRLPDGDWYLFKGADGDPAGEYSKFEAGDLASASVASLAETRSRAQ